MWRNIKGFIVLGVLAIAGSSFLYTRYFGSGTLHVVTVADGSVTVTVDDLPLLETSQKGDHLTFKIKQGQHEVTVTNPGTGPISYSVNVRDGFSTLLLPVRADQCFVRFNVTDAAYSSGKKDQAPPVAGLFKNSGEPIEVPSDTYLSFGELPQSRRDKQSVYLLRDMPCRLIDVNLDQRVLLLALSSDADQLFTNLDEVLNGQE